MDAVPELVPRKISLGLKGIGAVFPGAKETTNQIHPYTRWWSVQNQSALRASGPLLLAIGDSTSIGIGASHPSNSFVGFVARALSVRDGVQWRVINLGIAGARIDDAEDRQLHIADGLGPLDQVLCCIGSNDIVWTPAVNSVRNGLRRISSVLPEHTVFGPVAGASGRARMANRALRQAARENGQQVAEIWDVGGPRLRERTAADRFHPNDLGYALMASAITELLDAPTPGVAQTS